MARKTEQLTVGRRRITVSNLDKILYPGGKFSKARVIDYYVKVSKYLLPHLKDYPVTLKRFPDGVFGEFFYEKDAPAFTPEWVKTVPVPRRETPGPDIRYILIANLPEPASARRGEAITAEVMEKIQWLRPKLVAHIEFTEWTKGNHLRHSRFVALRDDKRASEVVKETAV